MAHSLRSRLKELWRKGVLKDGDLERIVIIPKDATNGDMLKALYPKVTAGFIGHYVYHIGEFDLEWWNAPYKDKE